MNTMVADTDYRRRTQDIIDSALAELGYNLVQVSFKNGSPMTLQIMAERKSDNGMDISDCAHISRYLSAIFDEEEPISDDYILEVSSAGIDRPLVRVDDFSRFAGHLVKFELLELVSGFKNKRFTGYVVGISQEGDNYFIAVCIDRGTKLERDLSLPYASIFKAKLVLTDELMREHELSVAEHATEYESHEELV